MKKNTTVLLIGLCIGFTIGAFTRLQTGGNDRNIARNSEFTKNEMGLPNIDELYLEALKNSKSGPPTISDSEVCKELKKALNDQMAFYKSQPTVKFDNTLYDEFNELLKKEKSEN
jgi:hypothetical protein